MELAHDTTGYLHTHTHTPPHPTPSIKLTYFQTDTQTYTHTSPQAQTSTHYQDLYITTTTIGWMSCIDDFHWRNFKPVSARSSELLQHSG